jgi:plasmid maintenance system killer protein
MVRNFRHKGLQRLFRHDDGSKLPPDMVARIKLILSTLHAAQEIEAMDIPIAPPERGIARFFLSYRPCQLADYLSF